LLPGRTRRTPGRVIAEIHQDVISGGQASRPGLNRLIADAAARKFEILLVWKLDRFGRSGNYRGGVLLSTIPDQNRN
jgi:DNA invertase Pin-like site-specific DNA recombinase